MYRFNDDLVIPVEKSSRIDEDLVVLDTGKNRRAMLTKLFG